MIDFKKDFGARVKKYRRELNLTQEKMAALVNVSVQTLSSIEIGHHFPSYPVLVKIVEYLKIPPYKLFIFDNEHQTYNDKELAGTVFEALRGIRL